jgi:hypothetical protein
MASNSKILFVGVGGTGSNMVQKIIEKWERDGQRPRHVAIALLDAHSGRPQGAASRTASTFSGSHKIDYPKEHSRYKDARDCDLADWWPSRVYPQERVGFHDGCGAIRPNGRFWTMSHADRIRSSLERAMDTLSSAGSVSLAGQTDEVQWEAYVCCSLGNGTGGGSFMAVGAMVKDLLRRRGSTNPKVVGVFIPGSVTRWGSAGRGQEAMQHQVASSGFAALIELQHEFNRDRSDGAHSPDTPYVHKGWSNGYWHESVPWYGIPAGDSQALRAKPFDTALILDRFNPNGYKNEYNELFDAGAEALKSLLGGADQDSRLLDLEIKMKEGRRFGSLGAISYVAPTQAMTDWGLAQQVLNAIKAAGNKKIELPRDAHLLQEKVPGGAHLTVDTINEMRGADAALEASVDFFIDHVLEAKEKDDTNDLFDRFEPVSQGLQQEFDSAVDSLTNASQEEAVRQAEAVVSGLMRVAQGNEARFQKDLDEYWDLKPDDPQDYSLGEAGVKWLLEERVSRFVDAGAFGVADVWLGELDKQVKANLASVYATEWKDFGTKESLNNELDVNDLQRKQRQLSESSESIFARFSASKIQDFAGQVATQASDDFRQVLWQMKVQAVVGFYDRLTTHIAVLKGGVNKTSTGLATLLADARASVDDAVNEFGKIGEGTREKPIGAGAEMRQQLIEQLEATSDASSAAILANAGNALWLAFAKSLGGDIAEVRMAMDALSSQGQDPSSVGRMSEQELFTGVRLQAAKRSSDAVRARVGRMANVEQLMVNEAMAVITDYYNEVHTKRGQSLGSAAQDATDKLYTLIPQAFVTDVIRELEDHAETEGLAYALSRPDPKDDSGNRTQGAVQAFLRGRIFALVQGAKPLWNPQMDDPTLASVIQRAAFFTYSSTATQIAQAVKDLKDADPDLILKAQDDPYFPTHRLECVSVELGAELDWITSESEVHSYKLAMDGLPNAPEHEPYRTWFAGFNPHAEQRYEAAGRDWLEQYGIKKRGSKMGAGEGEFVAALASLSIPTHPELFGYIKRDKAVHRSVKQLSSHFPANATIGPKSLSDFTDWLEGINRRNHDGATGLALSAWLKEQCWNDIQTLIKGSNDGSSIPMGLERLVADSGPLISKGVELKNEKAQGEMADAIRAQGVTLIQLAHDLKESGGDRPTYLKK